MRHRPFLLAAASAVAGLVALWPAAPASAHPLGNFTVNHYAELTIGAEAVDIDYVVDRAELPSVQVDDAFERGRRAWAASQCDGYRRAVALTVDGHDVAVRAVSSSATSAPGAADLPTIRVECRWHAAVPAAGASIRWRDRNDAERVGWHEVTAVGSGVVLARSDVPAASVSKRLTSYPTDRLSSPLDVRAASIRVSRIAAAGAATSAASPPAGAPRRPALPLAPGRLADRLTGLVGRDHLTVPFLAVAMLLAILLGGAHAVAPGHGKTVIAAYLVGERGGVRHAVVLGAAVAISHTAGVAALGLVLTASRAFAPERLYPWLTLASGALFALMGLGLLRRSLRERAHTHAHAHGHHHHHDHHDHGETDDGALGVRRLVALGLAGGIVPTPTALVVLLGGIALGRWWLGLVLVALFGLGMALVLTAAGVVLARLRERLERWSRLARWSSGAVPLTTAAAVVVGGLAVALRGAVAL